MKTSALRKGAVAAGVNGADIDAIDDADDPRVARSQAEAPARHGQQDRDIHLRAHKPGPQPGGDESDTTRGREAAPTADVPESNLPEVQPAAAAAATPTAATRSSTPPRSTTPASSSSSSSNRAAARRAMQTASAARTVSSPRAPDSPALLQQIATLCARADLGHPSEDKVRRALKAPSGRNLEPRRQQVEAVKILRAEWNSGGKG
jgi:hypothetical protein